MLQSVYYIAGIIVAIPVVFLVADRIRERSARRRGCLDMPRRRFASAECDLARVYSSRFVFMQHVFRFMESARSEITVAAMGAGTILDIRGQEQLESLVARKLAEPDFESITFVLWDPSSEAFEKRLAQLKPEQRIPGRTNILSAFSALTGLSQRHSKFFFRTYRSGFQPTMMFIMIDRKCIWMSPYFNEVVGKNSPLVFEFHQGGDVFSEMLNQVEMLKTENYSTSIAERAAR